MNCEKCHSTLATVHCTSIEGGKSREIHLCAKCASSKEAGIFSFGVSIGQLLEPILKEVEKVVKSPSKRQSGQKKCPACGVTWAEISEMRRLNCPSDYEVFAEEIEVILRECHHATRHVGKKPGMNPEERVAMDTRVKNKEEQNTREEEIKRLTKEMSSFVEKENYEKAAEIRDRIKSLENPPKPAAPPPAAPPAAPK